MVFSPAEMTALILSVKIGFVAASLALPFAIGVAYSLARFNFTGKFLLDALVHLPLILPPVVVGYILLIAFGRNGAIGSALYNCCGISFGFRWTGAALASAIMAFPLMVRAIRLSIDAVDQRFEHAAATIGASPYFVFISITLPLAAPGLLAAYVLGFAKALGEFGATITFVSNIPGETQTLPLAIYSAMQTPDGNNSVVRLVMISIAISVLALLGSEWLSSYMRKRSAR